MIRLDEIRARLAAVVRAGGVAGPWTRDLIDHAPTDLAFLLSEVERLTEERDEAVAAPKDVGGPLCECGHEGDLYHYTDGARGCTAGDCPCKALRWRTP